MHRARYVLTIIFLCVSVSKTLAGNEKMIPELGVVFKDEGIAILDAEQYALTLNVSLKALNWTMPTVNLAQMFSCEQTNADLQMLCARMSVMNGHYIKMHNEFVEEINAQIKNEIEPRMKGKVTLRKNEKMPAPPRPNFEEITTEYHAHLEALVGGSLRRKTTREAWNWMYPNQVPGNEAPTSYLWQVVLRNGEGTFAQRYGQTGSKALNYDWNCYEIRQLDQEYFALWPTIFLNEEERNGMTGLTNERLFPAIQNMRRKVDLARDRYVEMGTALTRYFAPRRVQGLKRVNEAAVNSANKRTLINNKWNALKTKLVEVYNLYTRQAVRELATLAITTADVTETSNARMVRDWLLDMRAWWNEAEMTKSPMENTVKPPVWEVNVNNQLQKRTRNKRQVGIAIGLGIAALVSSAAGATASQFKTGSLDGRLKHLEKWQTKASQNIDIMQGNYVSLAHAELETCQHIQSEIEDNRKAMTKITQWMNEQREWERFENQEMLKVHEMIMFLMDVLQASGTLMAKEYRLQNAYKRQLDRLSYALDQLELGKLSDFWINPEQVREAMSAIRANLQQEGFAYEIVLTDEQLYYQLPVKYSWERQNLLIQVFVPIRKSENPVHNVLRVESIQVPYQNDGSETKLSTKLVVEKEIFLAAPVNYAMMTQQELKECNQIGKLYVCDKVVMQHKTAESLCLSAIYEGLEMSIIKDKCDFETRTTKLQPQSLQAENRVLMSGFGNNWKFKCDDPLKVPKTQTGTNFGTITKEFLCECSIEGNDFEIPSSKENCDQDFPNILHMEESVNLAVAMYFHDQVQGFNATLNDLRTQIGHDNSILREKYQEPTIKEVPKIQEFFQNEKDAIAPLQAVVSAAKHGRPVFTNMEDWNMAELVKQKNRTFWNWVVRGTITLTIITAIVILCVCGKRAKKRINQIQFAQFWRQIMSRQSLRDKQEIAAKRARDRVARSETKKRVKTAAMLEPFEMETVLE